MAVMAARFNGLDGACQQRRLDTTVRIKRLGLYGAGHRKSH
jgi:hypothetical protein